MGIVVVADVSTLDSAGSKQVRFFYSNMVAPSV